jgi:hypothetical protein
LAQDLVRKPVASFSMVRDEGSVEADRSFHVLCGRVESNKRIRDDAVTNVRKPAYLPPLTA